MKNKSCREIFAKNIKKYMELRGKTQNDIIKDLSISSSVISGWCNAVSFPRIEKIETLAEYLDINVVDFFIEENNQSPNMDEIIKIA